MNNLTRLIEIEGRTQPLIDLRDYMKTSQHSLLCVGPMSKNCVDAVIGLANQIRQPIPLIASRRQIDTESFGGGYVNHWNTRKFSEYVRSQDKGFVHLCRDHGGPWQGEAEAKLSTDEALRRAKASFLEDIASGFDILHLDPSIQGCNLTDERVLSLLFELYGFVNETARSLGRSIEIEVGTEQQSGAYSEARELVSFLKSVTNFCDKNNFRKPLFCVVQTGTLVKEMRNVGFTEGRRNEKYDQKYAVETMEKTLSHLVDIAYINSVFVKEHNGDYLSDGSMSLRRRLQVGAVNIAPELGVAESKALVTLCRALKLKNELEGMLRIFYDSCKWEKWLSSDSQATDLEKAIIAGHYSFSKPEFQEIKESVARTFEKNGESLDHYLTQILKAQLQRMIWNLGYFHDAMNDINIGAAESRNTRPVAEQFI